MLSIFHEAKLISIQLKRRDFTVRANPITLVYVFSRCSKATASHLMFVGSDLCKALKGEWVALDVTEPTMNS